MVEKWRGSTMLLSLVLASLMVFGVSTRAESAPYTLPDTDVIDLPVASNDIDYQLYVHVPPGCRKRQPKCRGVYLLDADYSFALSVQIVTHLSDRNRISPVVSVAIGYPDKRQYRLSRTRDYTPFFVADSDYGKAIQRQSGGGSKFLSVLRKEIIPYIEKQYPVSKQGRVLAGHSYGGLFALYAWLLSPQTFEDYIIVSPSLWYGDKKLIGEVSNVCSEHTFKLPRDIFLAVGEYEEQPNNSRTMVSDLKQLETELKTCSRRTVNTDLRIHEDETHASIFPTAYSAGLRKHLQ